MTKTIYLCNGFVKQDGGTGYCYRDPALICAENGFTPMTTIWGDLTLDAQNSEGGYDLDKYLAKLDDLTNYPKDCWAFIDLEGAGWMLTPDNFSEKLIENYKEVLEATKFKRPDMKIGFYRVAPLGNWCTYSTTDSLDSIQAKNKAMSSLMGLVDFVMPEIYIGSRDYDLPGIMWGLRGLLSEAKNYGKPVIPILAPYYLKDIALISGITAAGFEYTQEQLFTIDMPPKVFRMYLEQLTALDVFSVAIWGAGNYPWDEKKQPWITELLDWAKN